MRALICSTSGAGHLGPLLPFARALREGGAEVTFVVPGAAAEALGERWGIGARAAAGEPGVGAGEPRVIVAEEPPAKATAALWKRVAAAPEEAARLVNGELFGALCTAAMLPAVERACAELERAVEPVGAGAERVLVLHEPCAYAAPIAAARRGLPCAQVAISLAHVEAGSLAHAAPALERIEPGIVARLRAQPYLTRFPAALDPSPFADTRRYREPRSASGLDAFGGRASAAGSDAGPAGGRAAAGREPEPLPDWWPGDARPLVYATLGSVAAGRAGAGEAYRALAAAAARLDARVLLTVGREIDPAALGPLPPHVRVERWVAQERVLPHAAAVVCHGGSGTLFGALAAGLPVVALPLFADQPVNARLLAEAGAGIVVPPPAGLATVVSGIAAAPAEAAVVLADDLVAATRAVLAEPSYARAAVGIASQTAAAPTAAQLLREGLNATVADCERFARG